MINRRFLFQQDFSNDASAGKRQAALTPFAVTMPRYWREIASGVYPAFVDSKASETEFACL